MNSQFIGKHSWHVLLLNGALFTVLLFAFDAETGNTELAALS